MTIIPGHKLKELTKMVEIRPAKKDDIGDISSLIYSAGPEMYDFIYKTADRSSIDYIRYEYLSGRGFCGFNNVTVAIESGSVIATGCFYDGKKYKKLLFGTLLNMFLFYGIIKIWKVLERLGQAGGMMEEPRQDELYLSNFGVSPDYRGRGIGSLMLDNKIGYAKNSSYSIFSLDVAETNPRAEALYNRKGLSVVKHKVFRGKRPGIEVPNAKKMELVLSSL
ncbi:MAG: GNAT family N-acetyltransferase [Pseudomonadales bacterium]|nr:GNAT family N-acetyltransferase [Pseudomonadales bacterium]